MPDKLEAAYLARFVRVAEDLDLPVCRGHGQKNCFDPGFDLGPKQRFQFGDLRVERPDRTVLVEVESGGGLTNLVKYWPLACVAPKPVLLLHVYAQSSDLDYVAHHRLWEFTWRKMSEDLARTARGRLIARKLAVKFDDPDGWDGAVNTFKSYLTAPLDSLA